MFTISIGVLTREFPRFPPLRDHLRRSHSMATGQVLGQATCPERHSQVKAHWARRPDHRRPARRKAVPEAMMAERNSPGISGKWWDKNGKLLRSYGLWDNKTWDMDLIWDNDDGEYGIIMRYGISVMRRTTTYLLTYLLATPTDPQLSPINLYKYQQNPHFF